MLVHERWMQDLWAKLMPVGDGLHLADISASETLLCSLFDNVKELELSYHNWYI